MHERCLKTCLGSAVTMVLIVNAVIVLMVMHSGLLINRITGDDEITEIFMQLIHARILPSVGGILICVGICCGVSAAFRRNAVLRKILFVLMTCLTVGIAFLTVRVNSMPMHLALDAILKLVKGGVL